MESAVGVDLHERVTQIAVLGPGEQVQQYRVPSEEEAIARVLARVPRGTRVAVEATRAWWWFVDQAEAAGYPVVLSHPKQTKAIAAARLKTDRVDAAMLARLLRADLLPTVWIPGPHERQWRELVTHRARRTIINELYAVYAKRHVRLPGRVWLRAEPVAPRVNDLSGAAPGLVERDVTVLRLLNTQIADVDAELARHAQADPGARRLLSIPGVGPMPALAVRSWVGDVRRCAQAKQLASYFGLAPRVRQSAAHTHRGPISKEGSRVVRWLVVQAALSGIRFAKGPTRRHYLRVLRRRGRPIARIAAARKLVGIMFQLLRHEMDYDAFVSWGRHAQ